jgi:anti-sigma B factor antagonist
MRDPAAVAVVLIGGDVDLETSADVAETIQQAVDLRPPVLVLDLTDVSFLSSIGLSVLIETKEETSKAGVVLRLVASQRAVLHPMQITGLTAFFDIYPTVAEAQSATVS